MARAGAEHGYVFCVRVADHDTPLFRYVRFPDDAEPEVIGDTLTCLANARPDDGDQTSRILSEATHHRAYDAWQLARNDIFVAWMEATDPRNLAPSIPRPLRDAAALLRDHHPDGYTQQQVDALIDALQAPHLPRVQREIRDALRASADSAERAAAVADRAYQLGLQPAPTPDPLPVITPDDIHLICWLAIVPATNG